MLSRSRRVGAERAASLCVVSSIGVMREGPLHAAVKAVLAQAGDRLEVPVDGFVIDLVRADGELVEVQTGGFGALGTELDAHRFFASCTRWRLNVGSCASTSTARLRRFVSLQRVRRR